MDTWHIAYGDSEDRKQLTALLEEFRHEAGLEERLTFRPVKSGFGKDPAWDLLLVHAGLARWDWLPLLLENQGLDRPRPVALYCPEGTVPGAGRPLQEIPNLRLYNDPGRLKEFLRSLFCPEVFINKTILFVDDDVNVLKAYARNLHQSSWRIMTITNGEEAIQILQKEKVDLIVTDIKMPEMHGFTLIAKIRQENKTVPIVVCSAYPGLRQDADLYFYKVSDFIEKPVSLETLEAKIRDLLS